MSKNKIEKIPIHSLGYNFIEKKYIPRGKDEYYLRDLQNRSGIRYRSLTGFEIKVLLKNNNSSDNWDNVKVSEIFNPELIKNCRFLGLVRIGNLEPVYLSFRDLKATVGLYNSTIISCDLGDNVAIDNVNLLSHYLIGSETIIANVNELLTTNHSKFGNGILKKDEEEDVRIWIELCNENGGRKILPFNGMLPGDAYLWSKYRADSKLMHRFQEFTEKRFNDKRGYYGKVGDRSVIKNCAIIKDVWIGTDAYIKGANKLKNLTINSGTEGLTQIGEGCELVNGIIGYGCKLFYGVKAVRFIMASHSQLKYGARLINSYLGNNATVSCCEVLNSLIFPAHEQHHNNSFLCAALVMGQSNIAAGATLGSNHNSRGAEGEMVTGRGFWPGLCVSVKHNSKFASFTILAKGNYDYELNISLPFSLVSIDHKNDCLQIMPGYWFLYNMYALTRNSWKYEDRDCRTDKIQHLEFDYLAPDTINEMLSGLEELEYCTGKAYYNHQAKGKIFTKQKYIQKGKELLSSKNKIVKELEITAEATENSNRKVVLLKVQQAYDAYRKMIYYYGAMQLTKWLEGKKTKITKRQNWENIGGQLMPEKTVETFKKQINAGKISSWDEVHNFYEEQSAIYENEKLNHALATLSEYTGKDITKLNKKELEQILKDSLETKKWICDNILISKQKDYKNPYRKMIYSSQKEMDQVLGKIENNSFIKAQKQELRTYNKLIKSLLLLRN